MKKKISIVIPVYNEEEVLPILFKRLTNAAKKWNLKWEVICIDDGSVDRSWDKLQKQSKKDKHWQAISFSRNFGHQTAISCGIHYATGDAVVIMDADLQDPPEDLYRYIKKWQEGYDVVYAIRTKRKEKALKKFSYWFFYRVLSKLSNFDIPLDTGDFSLMDRKVVDVLKGMPERNRFVRGLRAWSGFRQVGLEYERQSRAAGEPKYTLKKLMQLAFDGIISFSSAPLTIASYLGLWVSLMAILGILFTLIQRIFKPFFESMGIGPVPGFATTVIAILFLGGVQLIFLGILGSYLSRIYDEVKGRPHWVIKDQVGVKSK
jgi:polyisoprenyl-phosphate glycosyltransferase